MKPNAMKFHRPEPNYLRKLVARTGLTQQLVADLIGITPRSLRYYLAGERPIPYTVQYAIEELV